MDVDRMADRFVARATIRYAYGQKLLREAAVDAEIEVPPAVFEPESLLSYPDLYAFPYSWNKILESCRHLDAAAGFEKVTARRCDFAASTKIPGFWQAIQGPFAIGNLEANAPDSEKALIRLALTQGDDADAALGRFLAMKLCDKEPEFSIEMGRLLTRRKKPRTAVRLKLHAPSRDPKGALMRGWASHFFWLMTPSCRSQYFDALDSDFKELSVSMDEKFRKSWGLYCHPNPPLLQIRDGDSFKFTSGWNGPKPRPSHLLAVKP